MLRFICRLVGFLALAAAAAALAYDGVTSVFAESLHVSSVAEVWEHIPASWLAALEPMVAWLSQLWREMIQPYLLQQPVWLVLGIAGATLLWAKEEASERTQEDCDSPCAETGTGAGITRGSASLLHSRSHGGGG